MVKIVEIDSSIPSGLEIVVYNAQEAQNRIIAAEPISWRKPNEVQSGGPVEGEESTRKRNRSVLEMENDKEFSLEELYKSDNIDEVISSRQKDHETTLDPQELLKNLKGWTIKNYKRTERNGRERVDKTYHHPKCKGGLRSKVELRRFIEKNSYVGRASDNREVGSQDNGMTMPRRQPESSQTNFFMELFD